MWNKPLMPVAEIESGGTCRIRLFKTLARGDPHLVGALPSGSYTVSSGVFMFSFQFSFTELDPYDTVIWAYRIGRQLSDHGGHAGGFKAKLTENSSTGQLVNSSTIESSTKVHIACMVTLFVFLYPILFFSMWLPSLRPRLRWIHSGVGVVAIGLLIAGWSVTPSRSLNRDDSVGKIHKSVGLALVWITLAVSVGGMAVNVLWNRRFVKLSRTIHGIGGGVIAFTGPLVCWTGWRLWGEYEGAFYSQPFVWLVPIYLGVLALLIAAVTSRRNKMRCLSLPEMSGAEFKSKLASGEKLLVMDGYVVNFGKFLHPGGDSVLVRRKGEDVSAAFRAVGAHSDAAFTHVLSLAVAKYAGEALSIPMTALGKNKARVISVQHENKTVKRFRIESFRA